MGRLRGPRLSLGLSGLHLAGPRYYFGRRRRRRVTVSWPAAAGEQITTTGPARRTPDWWALVDRVELAATRDGSVIRLWHEGRMDELAYRVPVGVLSAAIRPWLGAFRPDGQTMLRR